MTAGLSWRIRFRRTERFGAAELLSGDFSHPGYPMWIYRATRRDVEGGATVLGEVLEEGASLGSYHETHHDAKDDFLHVFVELQE